MKFNYEKLQEFLESDTIKKFYGEYDLGINISNYQSGCYVDVDDINGYNIHLDNGYVMITIGNDTKEVKFKTIKELCGYLKENL